MQNGIVSHNAANELRTRDTDRNSSVNHTLTHDAVGNLTDDGKDYSYVSDAFGRLKTVKNRGNSAVVAEYTYNGLNMRIDWHTSYGIPFRIDPGDYNRDGFVNGTDFDDYGDDFDNTRAEADVDFDGDVDEDDYDLCSAWWDAPSTAGRFTLSASSVANRIGYAGYQHDPTFVGASRAIYHVRNRVYDAGLGRWTRRGPLAYVDEISIYKYCKYQPCTCSGPSGLRPPCGATCLESGSNSNMISPAKPPTKSTDIYVEQCRNYAQGVVSMDIITNQRCLSQYLNDVTICCSRADGKGQSYGEAISCVNTALLKAAECARGGGGKPCNGPGSGNPSGPSKPGNPDDNPSKPPFDPIKHGWDYLKHECGDQSLHAPPKNALDCDAFCDCLFDKEHVQPCFSCCERQDPDRLYCIMFLYGWSQMPR